MQSLVVTVPLLRWDEPGEPPDDPNSMLGRALTYLVLFSTLGMFVRWSIGAHLLSSAGTSLAKGPATTEGHHPPRWAASFPNSPEDSDSSDADNQAPSPLSPADPPASPRTPPTRKTPFERFVLAPLHAVHGFMTAPLWAAVMSLVVALLPPVQALLANMGPLRGALDSCGACSIPLTLVALGAYFVDHKTPPPPTPPQQHLSVHQDPPLVQTHDEQSDDRLPAPTTTPSAGPSRPQSVSSTAYAESETSGARLKRLGWNPWRRTGQIRLEDEPAPEDNGVYWGMSESTRTIAAAIGARMLLCPLVLIPIMAYIAIKTNNNVLDDPVFLTSACLIVGSPPALTLAQITTQTAAKSGRGNAGAVERLISRTIFVAYTILATPTTIALVLIALLIAEND